MPDTTTTTDPAAAATATTDPPADPSTTEPTDPPADLSDAGKQALDRMKAERNEAKKQATQLKAQLDAINQANESAIEKAQREATEAAAKATDYERQLLVQKVALDKGVPAAHIHRLSGSSEAELAADADELMAALNTPGSPKPDPSQGAKGGPAATGGPAQDFANIIQNMGQ